MGKFVISKKSNGQFRFNLKANNGEIILSSEGYTTKQSCLQGIESVRNNASNDSRYDRQTSTNNKYYFTLNAANGEVIGTGELYESAAGRETGIASVKSNAPAATVEDGTA